VAMQRLPSKAVHGVRSQSINYPDEIEKLNYTRV